LKQKMSINRIIFPAFILLANTKDIFSRRGFFSEIVDVSIFPGSSNTELQMFIGTLEILLIRRDDILQSLVTANVGGVVMGHLTGSFYTGMVTEKQDCNVRMWIREMNLISGNIDCKRKHFVLEKQTDGQYVMHKKLQTHKRPTCNNMHCQQSSTNQKVCTLFIHADPYLWRHIRNKYSSDESTKEAIIRQMMDHIMSANEMYDKYKFAEKYSVQFVLAGLQIDSDNSCQAQGEDFSGSYHEYQLFDLGDDNYSEYEYYVDYDSESNNVSENEDVASIFDLFLMDDYEDEDWNPDIEYVDEDVHLNDENCYEDIKGVVNITNEFCKLFLPDEGVLYLNMFSTIDHSSYCLAHIWTYRRLEVLGLADTPTDGAPGLSGFCAYYDQQCHIGFNTGLLSFQHQGAQLNLADSQDTFIHELGHSLGAAHDPTDNPRCAPGGKKGNYIMSPGPHGNEDVRRELSPCSKRDIDKVFDELFEHSCLVSWGDINGHQQAGVSSELTIINPDCDASGMMIKIGTYLTDLKHFTETRRKKKVINEVFRKFKKILRIWDNNHNNTIKKKVTTSLKVFFREIQELFKIFSEEMEIFLVRKIHNLGKSVVKCISNKTMQK